jgi:hypothetical protein
VPELTLAHRVLCWILYDLYTEKRGAHESSHRPRSSFDERVTFYKFINNYCRNRKTARVDCAPKVDQFPGGACVCVCVLLNYNKCRTYKYIYDMVSFVCVLNVVWLVWRGALSCLLSHFLPFLAICRVQGEDDALNGAVLRANFPILRQERPLLCLKSVCRDWSFGLPPINLANGAIENQIFINVLSKLRYFMQRLKNIHVCLFDYECIIYYVSHILLQF